MSLATSLWNSLATSRRPTLKSQTVEENNNVYDQSTENWLDLGATYQHSNRIQLNISTDIDMEEPKTFWNVSIGVTWQITTK